MNFILKNIGWIALFIFFAIMLLIISANQKDNLVTNKALQDAKKELILTGSEVVDSGSGVLTDLVKMLDDEDKTPEIKADESDNEEAMISGEAKASLVEIDRPNPLKAFFAKFKRDKKDEVVMDDKNESEEQAEEVVPDTTMVKTSKPSNTSTAKMADKKMTFVDTPNYSTAKRVFPGLNLQTAVGNTYQVGAHYLNLNNASFTQSLGVMAQNDIVRQLTPADKHGCFEVEVLSSKMSAMIGKVGCVCKKWLKENIAHAMNKDIKESTQTADTVSDEGSSVSEAPQANLPNVTTKIGDVHSVATPGLKLNNKSFDTTLTVMKRGDKLEQIGDENKYGCFQIRILTSDTPNDIGRVGYVCKKYVTDSDNTPVPVSDTTPTSTSDAPVVIAQDDVSTTDTPTSTDTTSDSVEAPTEPTSKIGDVYEVSIDSLNLRDSSLTNTLATMSKGDKLEQISAEDANGCFQTRILTSGNANDVGRVGYVCSDSIEASELICK